jgi:hypothetical protein
MGTQFGFIGRPPLTIVRERKVNFCNSAEVGPPINGWVEDAAENSKLGV